MYTSEYKGKTVLYPSQFERVQLPRYTDVNVIPSSRPILTTSKHATRFRTPFNTRTVWLALTAFLQGRYNRSGFLTFRQLLLVAYLWRKGFINYVVRTVPESSEPQRYYYHANAPFFAALTDACTPAITSLSRGFSDNQELAFQQTIGECLERVPFLYYRTNTLMTGTYARVRQTCTAVDPALFDTFSTEQRVVLGLSQCADDSVYRWQSVRQLTVEADSLQSKPVLVPAQAVWRQYPYLVDEPRLAEFSTHGYAAHYTQEQAMLSALYEWIERDGFFAHWLWGVVPPRIAYTRLRSTRIDSLVEDIQSHGYTITCLDVTMPDIGIPAIFCVLTNPSGLVYAVGGAGCNVNLEVATYKALCEATSMLHWSFIHAATNTPTPTALYPYPNQPYSDVERFTFWAQQHRSLLEPWLQGAYQEDDIYSKTSLENTTTSIIKHLAVHGHDVYSFQAKHPVLDSLNFFSIKMLVPSLLPIYLDMRYAPLGHQRLHAVKCLFQAQGKRSLTEYENLYNYPHLFP